MSHIMKGNIALFCSQCYRICGENITIKNVENHSISNEKDACSSYGILFTGCKDTFFHKNTIENVISINGPQELIGFKNKNINNL